MPWQRGNVGYAGKRMNNQAYRYVEKQRYANTHNAGGETDDERFGVEHARYVAFGRAQSAQDADFLDSFENGDIGDYAYHYRRNDERNGHETDKHVRNGVDYIRYRREHNAHIIGVSDLLFVVDGRVVFFDKILYVVLVFKG